MTISSRRFLVPATALLLATNAFLMGGGPLNPPAGAVTATAKPLSELEPRIAINATNTPGSATAIYRITLPGSYYLTGNITGVTGKHGIEIFAGTSGVTIDLNGFEMLGINGMGAFDAVTCNGNGQLNIAVVNGSIRNWGGDGVDFQTSVAQNCRVDNIRVNRCTGNGIAMSNSGTVSNCTAWTNTGSGISAHIGVTITHCSVNNNTLDGITTLTGCTITDCTAWTNIGNGINAGAGTSITGCSTFDNDGAGIVAASGCTVAACTVRQNTLDGIQCTGQCLVKSNNCSTNGSGTGSGANIHATDTGNRIEANNCAGADRGIDVDAAGNMIVGNTCSGNTTNWDVAAGNTCFVLLATTSVAVTGDAGGVSPGATNPWANFSY
jgi:hypothetical protein